MSNYFVNVRVSQIGLKLKYYQLNGRMMALQDAHELGFRAYGMLCPLLPGIADSPEQIDELVKFAVDCGVQEIFAEPVNPRGHGLKFTQTVLEAQRFYAEAEAVNQIRNQKNWSVYVAKLLKTIQATVR